MAELSGLGDEQRHLGLGRGEGAVDAGHGDGGLGVDPGVHEDPVLGHGHDDVADDEAFAARDEEMAMAYELNPMGFTAGMRFKGE